MRNKKYFFSLLSISVVVFLLACNLTITFPGDATSIATPSVSNTPEFLSPPSTPTLFPTQVIKVTPFATNTLLFPPTITPTPQWAECPGIVVKKENTRKGDVLHILRCEDGLEYDLGPLAIGVYAVGPNDKFLVYVTLTGVIYASRIGDRTLSALYNLAREHIFTVFNKQVTPDFVLSIIGEEGFYKLVVVEKNYNQKRVYDLPSRITR
jgi:hypothetical protein